MKQTDKAYVAGFIDRSAFMGAIKFRGEYGHYKYTARISCEGVEPKTFDKVYALCGGHILKTKKGQTIWYLQGRERVAKLLGLLLPYLGVRKRAAKKLIQFNSEWKSIPRGDLDEKRKIVAKRDSYVKESLGLKATWRGEKQRAQTPIEYFDWDVPSN